MARYTDAVCKLCRREKQKLFLKGTKCFSEKCPVEKRNYPPGQKSGQGRRQKMSEYGIQLREKQKVRRTYGMLETPFRNAFAKAARQKGVTGTNLVTLLERRFDNVLYRLGLAASRKQARQLILHKHFLVNDKPVNIPSFLLKNGDIVKDREKSRKLDVIHESLKHVRDTSVPKWLSLDKAQLTGRVLNTPERADIVLQANEQLVVELYSK